MKISIVNKSGFELPSYARLGDSGMDLKAVLSEKVVLGPFERILVKTGIFLDIPEGYEVQIRSRSGEALKKGLVVLNSPGTIDSSYTGEVGCIMYNSTPAEVEIEPGERVAQMVLCKVEKVELIGVDIITKRTDRGDSGYGDSGKF